MKVLHNVIAKENWHHCESQFLFHFMLFILTREMKKVTVLPSADETKINLAIIINTIIQDRHVDFERTEIFSEQSGRLTLSLVRLQQVIRRVVAALLREAFLWCTADGISCVLGLPVLLQ